MKFVKGFVVAATIMSSSALHAQAAVSIDSAAIAEVTAACGGGDCTAALNALIAQLQAANPAVSLKDIIAAVAAEIGDDANSALGTAAAASLAEALDTLGDIAADAGVDIAEAIEAMADAVEAGQEVDFSAVASAGDDTDTDTGVPDVSGSDS